MTKLYALYGEHSRDVLTYQGRVIVHGSRTEMEWLFPHHRVVEFTPGPGDRAMWLKDHPSMGAVTFPLSKSDFR